MPNERQETRAAAVGGQESLPGGLLAVYADETLQLIRVRLQDDLAFIPEISANKYALMIRFTAPGAGGWSASNRPRQSEANVPFELTYCNL